MGFVGEVVREMDQLSSQAKDLGKKIKAVENKRQMVEQMVIYNIALGMLDSSEDIQTCAFKAVDALEEIYLNAEGPETVESIIKRINDLIKGAMGDDYKAERQVFTWAPTRVARK